MSVFVVTLKFSIGFQHFILINKKIESDLKAICNLYFEKNISFAVLQWCHFLSHFFVLFISPQFDNVHLVELT